LIVQIIILIFIGYEDLDDVDEHFEVGEEEVDDVRRNT
jgi:hypothetical protein